jgi:hypothetical protein
VNTDAEAAKAQALKPAAESSQREASPTPKMIFDVEQFQQQQAAEARAAGDWGRGKGGSMCAWAQQGKGRRGGERGDKKEWGCINAR